MRRGAIVLGASLVAAVSLSACGSSGLSYHDGYSTGQSMAATSQPGTLHGSLVVSACRHQWNASGPASDERAAWVNGCVAGVRQLEATLDG